MFYLLEYISFLLRILNIIRKDYESAKISREEKSSLSFLDKIFKYSESNSSVKTGVIGGITTFLTMVYIIFVNPAILLDAGIDKSALITVTILATAIGTS